MSQLFQPMQSETLSPSELAEITGCPTARRQVEWLDDNGWKHHKNRAGAPIVGRWYAMLKLAGITPQAATTEAWSPDFTGMR